MRAIQTVTRGTVEYIAEPYTLVDRPLWWHEQGLQQTSSGYGRKLTSSRCVRFGDGIERRVYITQFSNAGTAWIKANGRAFVVLSSDQEVG